MSAISDTSPLNYLVRLGYSEVLQVIYGKVWVPEAVLSELSDPRSPPEVRTWIANAPRWLQRIRIDSLDVTLPANLGAGEREAISLSQQYPSSLLIIDDRDGRLAALERNIDIAGTMAILSEAALRGLFDFQETMARLKGLGFRVSAEHESTILDRHAEKLRRRRLS